jgi:hypothetical protein
MADKTYGELLLEHRSKIHTMDDDVIEYRRAQEPALVKKIHDVAFQNKDKPQYINKDFYLVLIWVHEPVSGQKKPLVFSRISCPTPVFAQAVWKYRRNSGCLEYLWGLPHGMLYYHVINSGNKYLLDPETEHLAKTCFLMHTGELLDWVIKENGEKKDAVIKIQKEPNV